jgi:hypothetical protein
MTTLDHPPSPLRYTLGFLVMLVGVVSSGSLSFATIGSRCQMPSKSSLDHMSGVIALQIAPLTYFLVLRRRSPTGVRSQRLA